MRLKGRKDATGHRVSSEWSKAVTSQEQGYLYRLEQVLAHSQQTDFSPTTTRNRWNCYHLNGPGSGFFPRASRKGRGPADLAISTFECVVCSFV